MKVHIQSLRNKDTDKAVQLQWGLAPGGLISVSGGDENIIILIYTKS